MDISVGTTGYSLKTTIPDDILDLGKGLEKAHFFEVSTSVEKIGGFYFYPMPGCCGVVVSTRSYLQDIYRGTFGKLFHELKERVAKELGYSLLIATTELRNLPEVIGASNARWKHIHCFRNKRTSHDLSVMVKDIQ